MENIRFDDDTYWPCQCTECGWKGMSNETAGGEAMGDTGDYNEIVCPECIKPPKEKFVAVEEIKKPISHG